jgi:membrane protease subunit HflK
MPWKDDSKSDPKPGADLGPWDAPGATAAPTPKGPLRKGPSAKPKLKAAPRPWDDGDPAADEAPVKRPRLAPLRRPRPATERTGGGRSERGEAKSRRSRSDPNAAAPAKRGPDLDALKRRVAGAVTDRFAGAQGRRLRRAIAAGLALGFLGGWAASGLYQVGPDQAGVALRFGAFAAETGPGLHYHLPWPMGQVRLVPVGPARLGGDDAGAEIDASAPMLAADGAPVEVSYSLSWRVTDPRRFLFRVADAPDLLKRLAEGAVRRAVGAAPLEGLLSGDRGGVETAAQASLQQALDRLGAGVRVGEVSLRGVDPADAAEAGARDLAAALQDARGGQADAAAYRDKAAAEARGEQAKALQEAKGVADQEIAEAHGEADRFTALDAAYRQAPEETRERLYTETMERVLKAANKVVVDAPKGSTIVLPGSVVPQHGADAAPAASPAPPAAPSAATATDRTPSGGAT